MISHTPFDRATRKLHASTSRRMTRVAAVALPAVALPIAMAPISTAANSDPSVSAIAPVTDDAYTTSTMPDRRSGDVGKVAVGQIANADKVGFLKFRTGSVDLANAELALTITSGDPGALTVHLTGSGWDERSITYTNSPTVQRQVGEAALSGGSQTIAIPLDLPAWARSGEEISLAVSRTDGGISRIGAREASRVLSPQLRSTSEAADPGPVSTTLPVYVSPAPDSGSYIESYEARRAEGWASAFYTYWPSNVQWNGEWDAFVDRHPEGIPVVGSPKSVDPGHVRNFLDNLPQTWREQFTMAYYQEPEEDFTTPASRAQFRQDVSEMADLVRPYGVKNAVHLQEWTINPYNDKHWGGEQALSEFFNAEDVDYISWSIFPAEGRSMRPGIDRIKEFSEEHAPGVPWGITAAGSPVDSSAPIGGAARAERADIVLDAARYTAQVGGDAFGWFDHDEYNPGRDQLVAKDPALQMALTQASAIGLDGR